MTDYTEITTIKKLKMQIGRLKKINQNHNHQIRHYKRHLANINRKINFMLEHPYSKNYEEMPTQQERAGRQKTK